MGWLVAFTPTPKNNAKSRANIISNLYKICAFRCENPNFSVGFNVFTKNRCNFVFIFFVSDYLSIYL